VYEVGWPKSSGSYRISSFGKSRCGEFVGFGLDFETFVNWVSKA
jgi:hypothetical protein